MCEVRLAAGCCRLSLPGARWLSTGWNGGYRTADAADNLTVPTGFDRTDLAAYVAARRSEAGLDGDGPALLTGVDVAHARGATCGSVTAVATAGLSNPATLPLSNADGTTVSDRSRVAGEERPPPGTVNVLVGTSRSLADGPLAELLATVVEAKTATLSAIVGVTGTTSDAVAVGTDPAGDPVDFAGSGTDLGSATRACVRDAIRASLDSRYPEGEFPASVADAEHGTVTSRATTLFRP